VPWLGPGPSMTPHTHHTALPFHTPVQVFADSISLVGQEFQFQPHFLNFTFDTEHEKHWLGFDTLRSPSYPWISRSLYLLLT
jgi:hypothetical protein